MSLRPATSKSWSGEDVQVGGLEGKLASLWKEMASLNEDVRPVRTHIFNLLVCAQSRQEADEIVEDLKTLPQAHPSRSIILIPDRGGDESAIDAELTVQCEMPRAGLPARCHERAVLTVHGRAADHLSSVAMPLLVPDLSTYLWWPGQPLFGHRMFYRLLSTADQLIVDSAQFASPGDGLANLANLCSGRHSVNDFNWARLTPWREIIAQFFDAPAMRPYLRGIQTIRLEFGSGPDASVKATSSLLLLLGWMSTLLGWEPETTLDRPVSRDVTLSVLQQERVIPIKLDFRDHGAEASNRLLCIEVIAELPDEPSAHFSVTRSSDMKHVTISIAIAEQSVVTRVVPLNIPTDGELLVDELEVTRKDALFSTVVRTASRLAGREVWSPA